jgi:uncharacterized repeat protein (TIGR02543 family)
MEEKQSQTSTEQNIPPFRGLYRHVKISVKALDWIIVACIAVILIVVCIEMQDPGFTVTFDAKGGTDIPSQNCMWGQTIQPPQPPTREGYRFTGWYTDYGCFQLWDMENDTVETDMTLYAGWEPVS